MKKAVKRFVPLFLVVAMIVSIGVFTSADTAGMTGRYKSYCAVGDSVPTGYGPLDGYSWEEHYFNLCKKAYPGLVQSALGAQYNSMTTVSFRIVDALYTLGVLNKEDGSYDYQESLDYHGAGYMKKLDEMRNGEAVNRIKNSELITVEMGNMDVFIYPMNNSKTATGIDVSKYMGLAIEGYNQFLQYYPKLIKRIQEINPTATVMIVGMYNPYANYTFTGTVGKLFYTTLSAMTANLNLKFKYWANQYNTRYVDIMGVSDYFESVSVSDERLAQTISWHENHPAAEGHAYIAKCILSAVPAYKAELSAPQNGHVIFKIDGYETEELIMHRSGLGWTIRTAVGGKYICIASDGNSIELRNSNPTVWYFNRNEGIYTSSEGRGSFLKLLCGEHLILSYDNNGFKVVTGKVNGVICTAD